MTYSAFWANRHSRLCHSWLAKLMGGSAGVESTPGVGSTFWFTVNLRKGAEALVQSKANQDNAYAEDKARCFEAGMSDFLAKPFDPGVLFATLLHALNRREAK